MSSFDQISLTDGTVFSPEPDAGLQSFRLSSLARACSFKHRRGAKAWLCNAGLGTWKAVQSEEAELFRHLTRTPLSFADVCMLIPGPGRSFWEKTLRTWLSLGFISANGAGCSDINPVLDDTKLGSRFLALHMTEACSMHCRYCYNRSGEPGQGRAKILTPETACRFIERACRELPSPSLQIDFMGGEPLLALPAIKKIIETVSNFPGKYGKKLNYLMQTNGLGLTGEVIEFLKQSQVGLGISMDGPALWHDRSRIKADGSATHAEVEAAWKNARQAGLEAVPLAVITDPEQLADTAAYFIDTLDCRRFSLNICAPLGRAEGTAAIDPAALHKSFIETILKTLERARQKNTRLLISDLRFRLENLAAFRQDYMCLRSPCGMGTSILALGPDKKIYACEEYTPLTAPAMCLGSLDELGDLSLLPQQNEVLRRLRGRTLESVPKCRSCWLRRQCGGGCTHRTLAMTGSLDRPDPLCNFYRLLYPDLMWLLGQEPDLLFRLAGGPAPAGKSE